LATPLAGFIRLPSPFSLPQHPYEYRPQHSILLAVDQELSEGPAPRVRPELADPLSAFEIRQHKDVEQLGARSRPQGVEVIR
jgi:hypothetical protein